MAGNPFLKKIPNISLLFGYLFILLVLIPFGYIQYSSSKNLIRMNNGLKSLTLKIVNDKANLQILRNDYHEFIDKEIFSALQQTSANPSHLLGLNEIETRAQLISNIEIIGETLDEYQADLARSQMILMMCYIGLSIILSILLTFSEMDQIKKLEAEKSQRIIDQKLMEVMENERDMIAVELHDDVAQKLSILDQHFSSTKNEEHTSLLKRYSKDVIHKIRTMAQSLRSPDTENIPFKEQIEFLFSDFRSVSDIPLYGRLNGLKALNIPKETELHIYRIIQELLSNCRKHSRAEKVEVDILYVHPILKINYIDNGVGFSKIMTERGMGLRSIQYRLKIIGGEMERQADNGCSVKITIPVEL